jgi:hypothetical protein
LDIGGYPRFWKEMRCVNPVHCLNLDANPDQELSEDFYYVVGDGRALPYSDQSFALVFSNSVIEHVGSFEQQLRFANEVRRVGRAYWVQTPNRWFPVEPHLLGLFIHYLPWRAQRRFIRWLTLWGLMKRPTLAEIDEFLGEIRLLSARELRILFPEAEIYREVVFFLTKSFIVVKRAC